MNLKPGKLYLIDDPYFINLNDRTKRAEFEFSDPVFILVLRKLPPFIYEDINISYESDYLVLVNNILSILDTRFLKESNIKKC